MQGTGVWSFVKAERADKATKPPASKAAKKPEKVSLGKRK
jgi:hypothetical protein